MVLNNVDNIDYSLGNLVDNPILDSNSGVNGTKLPITLTTVVPDVLTVDADLKPIIVARKENVCLPFEGKKSIK